MIASLCDRDLPGVGVVELELGERRAGVPLTPAVIWMEAAERHHSVVSWFSADPGPSQGPSTQPAPSCTLPLGATSMQTSTSDVRFLDLAQQALNENRFGVNPELPREFTPVPFPMLVTSTEAWFHFLLRGTISHSSSWLATGIHSAVHRRAQDFHLNTHIFNFSVKLADLATPAHISSRSQ